MLIGVGLLVGKAANVGGNEMDVGGSTSDWLVGGATCVMGNVVGNPLPDEINVRVGADVFVAISVKDSCSGELLKLQALKITDINNTNTYP